MFQSKLFRLLLLSLFLFGFHSSSLAESSSRSKVKSKLAAAKKRQKQRKFDAWLGIWGVKDLVFNPSGAYMDFSKGKEESFLFPSFIPHSKKSFAFGGVGPEIILSGKTKSRSDRRLIGRYSTGDSAPNFSVLQQTLGPKGIFTAEMPNDKLRTFYGTFNSKSGNPHSFTATFSGGGKSTLVLSLIPEKRPVIVQAGNRFRVKAVIANRGPSPIRDGGSRVWVEVMGAGGLVPDSLKSKNFKFCSDGFDNRFTCLTKILGARPAKPTAAVVFSVYAQNVPTEDRITVVFRNEPEPGGGNLHRQSQRILHIKVEGDRTDDFSPGQNKCFKICYYPCLQRGTKSVLECRAECTEYAKSCD